MIIPIKYQKNKWMKLLWLHYVGHVSEENYVRCSELFEKEKRFKRLDELGVFINNSFNVIKESENE